MASRHIGDVGPKHSHLLSNEIVGEMRTCFVCHKQFHNSETAGEEVLKELSNIQKIFYDVFDINVRKKLEPFRENPFCRGCERKARELQRLSSEIEILQIQLEKIRDEMATSIVSTYIYASKESPNFEMKHLIFEHWYDKVEDTKITESLLNDTQPILQTVKSKVKMDTEKVILPNVTTISKPKGCEREVAQLIRQNEERMNCDPNCDNVEDFICVFCSKVCRNKDLLEVHLKTHKDYKSSACRICSKSFFSNSTLRKHLLLKHPDSDQINELNDNTVTKASEHSYAVNKDVSNIFDIELKTTSKKPGLGKVQCEFCGKTTSNRKLLQKHVRKMHVSVKKKCTSYGKLDQGVCKKPDLETKTNSYLCPIDGFVFTERSEFQKHISNEHSDSDKQKMNNKIVDSTKEDEIIDSDDYEESDSDELSHISDEQGHSLLTDIEDIKKFKIFNREHKNTQFNTYVKVERLSLTGTRERPTIDEEEKRPAHILKSVAWKAKGAWFTQEKTAPLCITVKPLTLHSKWKTFLQKSQKPKTNNVRAPDTTNITTNSDIAASTSFVIPVHISQREEETIQNTDNLQMEETIQEEERLQNSDNTQKESNSQMEEKLQKEDNLEKEDRLQKERKLESEDGLQKEKKLESEDGLQKEKKLESEDRLQKEDAASKPLDCVLENRNLVLPGTEPSQPIDNVTVDVGKRQNELKSPSNAIPTKKPTDSTYWVDPKNVIQSPSQSNGAEGITTSPFLAQILTNNPKPSSKLDTSLKKPGPLSMKRLSDITHALRLGGKKEIKKPLPPPPPGPRPSSEQITKLARELRKTGVGMTKGRFDPVFQLHALGGPIQSAASRRPSTLTLNRNIEVPREEDSNKDRNMVSNSKEIKENGATNSRTTAASVPAIPLQSTPSQFPLYSAPLPVPSHSAPPPENTIEVETDILTLLQNSNVMIMPSSTVKKASAVSEQIQRTLKRMAGPRSKTKPFRTLHDTYMESQALQRENVSSESASNFRFVDVEDVLSRTVSKNNTDITQQGSFAHSDLRSFTTTFPNETEPSIQTSMGSTNSVMNQSSKQKPHYIDNHDSDIEVIDSDSDYEDDKPKIRIRNIQSLAEPEELEEIESASENEIENNDVMEMEDVERYAPQYIAPVSTSTIDYEYQSGMEESSPSNNVSIATTATGGIFAYTGASLRRLLAKGKQQAPPPPTIGAIRASPPPKTYVYTITPATIQVDKDDDMSGPVITNVFSKVQPKPSSASGAVNVSTSHSTEFATVGAYPERRTSNPRLATDEENLDFLLGL